MPSVFRKFYIKSSLIELTEKSISTMCGDVVTDTGCQETDGGDAWCHVSRVSIRDKDNGIHPLPPVLVMTQLSRNISNPQHFLRVSVILRSGC